VSQEATGFVGVVYTVCEKAKCTLWNVLVMEISGRDIAKFVLAVTTLKPLITKCGTL
jgi:hypothetical protein